MYIGHKKFFEWAKRLNVFFSSVAFNALRQNMLYSELEWFITMNVLGYTNSYS